MSNSSSTLVLGATGATGKHVVQQLLEEQKPVHVIVRSKERFAALYTPTDESLLTVTEASLMDLTDEQWKEHVTKVDHVVCCLGHNMTFAGIWGKPRRLVLDITKRLTKALAETTTSVTGGRRKKLILMNSDGVAHPAGCDDKRSGFERMILFLLRHLVPPHADNEEAAAYLYSCKSIGNMDWVVLRPTNLINGDATEYKLYSKPIGSLFGSTVVTRANVAKAMVELVLNDGLFQQYKFQMPVVYDAVQP